MPLASIWFVKGFMEMDCMTHLQALMIIIHGHGCLSLDGSWATSYQIRYQITVSDVGLLACRVHNTSRDTKQWLEIG